MHPKHPGKNPRKKPKISRAAKNAPGRPTRLYKIDASPEKVAQVILQGGAPKQPETRKD